MKNIIKRKICFALMALLTASSCGITQDIVWGPKYYNETFKGFAMDENEQIILVGEKYDYAFEDEAKAVRKLLKNNDSKKINFDIRDSYLTIKGEEFAKRLNLETESKYLSESQKNLLILAGFKKVVSELHHTDEYKFYTEIKGKRILKAQNHYLLILPLPKKNYYKKIWIEPTPIQTGNKILLTPFAIAADIILMPITLPYTIYRDYKISRTDYYCQGEFCGFDKVKNSSKNQKNSSL